MKFVSIRYENCKIDADTFLSVRYEKSVLFLNSVSIGNVKKDHWILTISYQLDVTIEFVSNFRINRKRNQNPYQISISNGGFRNEPVFVSGLYQMSYRYEIRLFRYELFRI